MTLSVSLKICIGVQGREISEKPSISTTLEPRGKSDGKRSE